MVSWRLVFTNQAEKDAKKLLRSGMRTKAETLLSVISTTVGRRNLGFLRRRTPACHLSGRDPSDFWRKKRDLSSQKTLLEMTDGAEKLVGDLEGAYSRRINIQHRLVYQVLESRKIVKVLRMWTHYE